MIFFQLYREASAERNATVLSAEGHDPKTTDVFTNGAKWMHQRMNENRSAPKLFNNKANYLLYGVLKYSLSLIAFAVALVLFCNISLFLAPLSIIVFYLVEVHFLFLFPLLIDGTPDPVSASIKLTYRTGLFAALINTMLIAALMLIGLARISDPLRNWYKGCLMVVLWYELETENAQ